MHPFMDIPAKKTPMLPDFGRRQFADTRKLVHSGLRHPEETRDLHHGQDLAVLTRTGFRLICWYRNDVTIHDR